MAIFTMSHISCVLLLIFMQFVFGKVWNNKGSRSHGTNDSNPGPIFTIPWFGIEKFLIPESR